MLLVSWAMKPQCNCSITSLHNVAHRAATCELLISYKFVILYQDEDGQIEIREHINYLNRTRLNRGGC